MSIVASMADSALLGGLPAFADLGTWHPWLAFLRAVYGLPMGEQDLELFRTHTGRTNPRQGGYPEAVVITGRQSGKSQIGAAVVAHEALDIAAQPGTYALLVAQDMRASLRAVFQQARTPFRTVPIFAREVVGETTSTLELRNGVTLAAYPCRPAALRGLRARVTVLDEAAFYLSTEGRPVDREMLRAARPTLATTGGKLLILTSPYGQSGLVWDLYRQHYGREDSPTLVWSATAPAMNPTLPADYLERMEQDDPEAYRSEVLGEFRAGLATLLDPEALEDVVATGVRERAPEERHRYVSFTDAASGSGKDAFTMAVAHEDGGRAVLDVVRAWRPPFNPSGVIAEAAELLRRYSLSRTTGDRYAPGFVSESFRSVGITYEPSERDRSALYLELLPAVNARKVLLLDDNDLLRELRGLERRRGPSGRDRVDHRPGAHDDRANAAAGALVAALERPFFVHTRKVLWG